MHRFVGDLKSRNEETRIKGAKDLYNYVSGDLREVSVEELNSILDDFNHSLYEMMVSGDSASKMGGILAIVALLNADVCNTGSRIHRFGNYLQNNCLPGGNAVTDPAVISLATKAIGRLTQVYGSYKANLRSDFINSLVKKSFEWLSNPNDRNDLKWYAAVLILREIAICEPTFFFQNVPTFFDLIFIPVRDSKPFLRESAVNALRAGLIVTAQREITKQSRRQYQSWYTDCYQAVVDGLENPFNGGSSHGSSSSSNKASINREDRIDGSLLVLSELLRCSNAEWERINRDLESITRDPDQKHDHHHHHARSHSGSGGVVATSVRKYIHRSHQLSSGSSSVSQIPFNWFGSVAPGKENVAESAICRQLLLEHYDEICALVLYTASGSYKNNHIQNTLLIVLPKLAAFQRDKFVMKYLSDTMRYLDHLLQGKESRFDAFIAIGLLAVATGSDIKKHISNTLFVIKQCLPAGKDAPLKKRSTALDPAIFANISMLARAVKGSVKNDVAPMLDSMFSVGLSPSLTMALHELARHIPSLKKEIADGLLKILSLILMQQPFRHPGTPLNSSTSSPTPPMSLEPVPSTFSVVLGLRTLGTFDFEGHSLLQFVRHCADTYLYKIEKDVRLEAVKTCSSLLKGTLLNLGGRQSPTVMSTINDVLAKLLTVGITDQDPDVRSCVMEYLDECFDFHLAQAENLSALFVALNDEQFEIRELAICIIGRLSSLNPAYIMPSLRKTLIQLLTEMEYSGIGRNKEQSARILGQLVSSAPKLVIPYVKPILKVLIPKLKENDSDPMVNTSVLRAIGDLAQVGGTLMKNYVDELLPLLLEMLNDSSSNQKREVSLWVLAQLVESTGSVITPYHRYPSLLDTLLNFLRLDQRPPIRTRTLRLLGLLGALDPYRHKMNMGQIDSAVVQSAPLIAINDSQSEMEQSYEMTPSEMLVNMGSGSLEEFYPSVAIASLMKIIRDPSQQHNDVVKAVTFIFKALGVKSVPYIPQVIPSMMNVIRTSDNARRDFLFQQLGSLISIVRQHIRNDLEDIFTLIKEFWVVGSQLQSTIIFLVENISAALGSEFKVYLPQLIPQILRVLMHDSSEDRDVTVKLLAALEKFGNTLDDYIHLILPPIVKLFDSPDVPIPTRKAALDCIDQLTDTIDFSEYASRIIHPLVRCLDSCPELRPTAMETLTSLAWQLGKKYTIFIHMVHKVLINHKINHQRYDILYVRLKDPSAHTGPLEDVRSSRIRNRKQDFSELLPPSSDLNMVKKHPFSATNLQKAWNVNRRVSKDDWLEWHSKLCIELLKASPSPALRACSAVAQQYSQLAKDLFNASFVSCWSELDAMQQDELMASLEQALTVPDLPEISQTILNLAEFMERCDKGPLPLDPILLGEQAMRCRAYAKALHYKEDEFHKAPSVPVLEALIAINNKLGQKEAAAGLLDWGRKNLTGDLKVQERWYEKLHNWERALKEYESKAVEDPKDPELILGKMRCLEAMGDWGDLHTISKEQWETASHDTRNQMARMASTAAWGLQDWEAMEKFVNCLPKESQDGGFYRAVLSIHHENWTYAEKLIDMTRELLDREVTALSLESYQRVYPTMVSVQMLAELEEVIEYKLIPERRATIKEMWWDRLQGCQRVIEDWQRIMQVRSLVLSPTEDQRTWLKYASLCRKSGRLQLSNKTLITILGTDPAENPNSQLPTNHPRATFAYCKHLWASDFKKRALLRLEEFVTYYLERRIYPLNQNPKTDEESQEERRELNQLLARCYLKLGQWQENLQGLNEKSIPKVFKYYASATEYDTDWYKAWHSLAVWSFESVLYHKLKVANNHSNMSSKDLETQVISTYGVPALKGFVRSINLSKGSSLQDTLRLLTLLFDYGYHVGMYEALHEGIRTIEIDNWLQVIPQLIARIDTPKPLVSRLVHQLLSDVGKHHPQALVYSLTVACKSNNVSRRQAAHKILNKMKEHSETLVNHAVTISNELIRVAILWHEQWHEGLEEASRMYFGDMNIPGMMAVLEPLHKMLEAGPQTMKEISFQTTYGQEINDAKKYCQRYQQSNDLRLLNHAWDIYYQVFRRIARQLPQLTQLELQYVSPQLLMCRDLELAVPGSYVPHQPLIRIMQVQPSLQVITSKQRPRKLCIRGSNGKTFMFLLKGHEDLRQDERVMQFFSLVNSLLLNDPETYRRNLAIQRFAVIPLSTNSGLIGWVPHSDTLHGLIKDYREKKRILLNIEHRIMQKMINDYDNLPLMNKVEVFEHSLEHTNGDDLATLLLLKSPSSEIWFDRRTNLTRSLAVMSMVGYVLGLGDRHPSNLLLDRMSGKILHIDFGDCFEVAMTREKYPEKIPFRLTRMLINAMEVTGIEGTYRRTCESVMTVLRRNKDSLMAVLEAFVYDPLLNWRLTNAPNKTKGKTHEQVLSNSGEDISGSVSSSVLRKLDSVDHTDHDCMEPEAFDPKALEAIQRVRDKLKGRDFKDKDNLVVAEQVDLLIKQATSNENLCQCFVGWCAFW